MLSAIPGRLSLALLVAFIAALAVTLVTRQGFERYQQTVTDTSIGDAAAHARGIVAQLVTLEPAATDAAATDDPPGDEARARSSLLAVIHASRGALMPLVDTAGLRGTFLEEAEAGPRDQATRLASELEDLASLAERPGVAWSVVAAQAVRVVHLAHQTGPRPDAPTREDVRRLEAFWQHAYVRDVRALDQRIEGEFDDFREWRQNRLKLWAQDDRWDEIIARLERHTAAADRFAEEFATLPAPPASTESAQTYGAAIRSLVQGFEAFREYVAGNATVERPSRLADEALAAFLALRADALTQLARLESAPQP